LTDLREFSLLIVDDDEGLREVIALHFEDSGCKILQACDGKEAYVIATRDKVDLVVSDIRMPGGSGLELLEKLRAWDPAKPAVILMTGFADYSEEFLLKKGAIALFNKPFHWGELFSLVEKSLLKGA